MKKYICEPCGYEYDPEIGDPDNGIAPGTAFEDLPEDWVCPLCGLGETILFQMRNLCRILFLVYSSASKSFCQSVTHASLGIRQSPLGESDTVPIFGPSGRQDRLNC